MQSPRRAWEARELSVRLRELASCAPSRGQWSRRGGRLADYGLHFRRAVRKSETINDLLTRYHMALMCQVQQTSLCNSVHDATSRLSRLLLVLSEQSEEEFSQERLADMLGLRRSNVTVAAQTLQSRRFISYRCGRIEILNRKGLKAAACECYEVVSRTFDQFLEDKQVTR
jgi:hypothetical protein